ncbi:secretion protein EspO, partial [Salmonella enterica subsp. enterica serovar Montevideo]|nr:secretion protein EspO [Salmonella enterica subsp. enterica serovar Montevideo]
FSRCSCSFEMRPPGTEERTPRLKLSATELLWLSKTIETEMRNTKE